MSDKPVKEIPLQTAIELACAAMRANGDYISESAVWSTSSDQGHRFSNKELMLVALGEIQTSRYEHSSVKPQLLCTNLEDRAFATDLQKYFRKLLFTAIEGEDQFKTDLYSVLNKETVPVNRLGFVACLPSTYFRDKYDRAVKNAENGFLDAPGAELFDLDCEIIRCKKSKNYDAFNVDAIIDNKLVSWMGKQSLKIGPCVLIKGKVKDHSKHWRDPIDVTRLNYVKAFQ
jgi:hypothetical protein